MTYNFLSNKPVLKFDGKLFKKFVKVPTMYMIDNNIIFSKISDDINDNKVLMILSIDYFQKIFGTFLSSQNILGHHITASNEINHNFLYNNINKFKNDFHSIEPIGKGGFGRVYSAENKIDLHMYAVKKILVSYANLNEYTFKEMLKEFRILAKLNHGNIVRYHTAWFEPVEERDIENHIEPIRHNSLSQIQSTIISNRNSDFTQHLAQSGSLLSSTNSSDDHSLLTDMSQYNSKISDNEDSKNNIIFDHNYNNEEVKNGPFKSKSYASDISNDAGVLEIYKHSFSYQSKQKLALFIQMELCHLTLKDWLDIRNKQDLDILFNDVSLKTTRSLSRQLLRGIDYLHSNNVIHRDIKPANIFLLTQSNDNEHYLQTDIQLKIGDFGLAKSLESDKQDNDINNGIHMTANVGTAFYSAPEVYNVKHRKIRYSHKCDLYSVGIILLELMWKFQTNSELCRVINDLSQGIKAQFLMDYWPIEAPNVMNLMSSKPEMRPEASFLLNETYCFKEMFAKSGMYERFRDLMRENSNLKLQNELLQKEINSLKIAAQKED